MYLYLTRESHEDEKSLLHRRPGQGLPCKRAQKRSKVINMIQQCRVKQLASDSSEWRVTSPKILLQILRSPRFLHSL